MADGHQTGENMTQIPDPLEVVYELYIEKGINAFKVAEGICLEQTVEVDRDLAGDPFISEQVVGQISELEPMESGTYRLKVKYSWDITADNIPQFLNLLYGNISMKPNIRVVDWNGDHPMFPGPRYGISALRKRFRESHHPLVCSALKPMGHTAEVYADMAYKMAMGGLHIIKDDHGLNNQQFCPFEERVKRVSDAVQQANHETGGNCLYFPNFGPSREEFETQLEIVKSQGIQGLLISPFLIGLDTFRYLAQHEEFILMAHPSFSGSYYMHDRAGMRPALLLGKLFRMLGADASIYGNIGGRFCFDLQTCKEINGELRSEHPRVKRAFPVPAGGMALGNISQMKQFYGRDLIFLIGGAVLKSEDLTEGIRAFRRAAFAEDGSGDT